MPITDTPKFELETSTSTTEREMDRDTRPRGRRLVSVVMHWKHGPQGAGDKLDCRVAEITRLVDHALKALFYIMRFSRMRTIGYSYAMWTIISQPPAIYVSVRICFVIRFLPSKSQADRAGIRYYSH